MLEQAVAEVNKAVAFDLKGKTTKAIGHYERAIQFLDQAKIGKSNAQVQAELDARITAMRKRMEELKRQITQTDTARPKESPIDRKITTAGTTSSEEGPNLAFFEDPKLSQTQPRSTAKLDAFKQQLSLMFDKAVPNVTLDDVIGLQDAKAAVHESIIFPLKFKNFVSRSLGWNAVLLYGPPGTGKTMLAMAIANAFNASFVSDIMSQWQGESEKQIRALFEIAMERAPCVVFIDEIDSLCSRRSDRESDSTRRVKTEFLIQMNKLEDAGSNNLVLVLAATNVPWDLDSASIRRFQRRIFVGLPDVKARCQLFKKELQDVSSLLSENDYLELARRSEGLSAHDITMLCRDASMEPLRALFQAKHFKPILVGGKRKFYPLPVAKGCPWGHCRCNRKKDLEVERAAIPMSFEDLASEDVELPPLHWSDVFHALTRAKRTVSDSELKKFSCWEATC